MRKYVVHYRLDRGGDALCLRVSSGRGHRTKVRSKVTCSACKRLLSRGGNTPLVELP